MSGLLGFLLRHFHHFIKLLAHLHLIIIYLLLILFYAFHHLLYSQVLDFLFIFFMIFLFLNHLREDSLNGVFYHILVVVWLKLSCCCCSDGLAVLTRIVLVHG